MKKGYKFKIEACPECGRLMSEHWIVRHLKLEHRRCSHCGERLGPRPYTGGSLVNEVFCNPRCYLKRLESM